MSVDAVLFSSYVPTRAALSIASEYVDVLTRHFGDCDVYVGINNGSIGAWREELVRVLPSVVIRQVQPTMAVDSDAAGYQAALAAMRESGKSYRLVWFVHTKGVTAERTRQRRQLIDVMLSNRRRITRLFRRYQRLGSYACDGTVSADPEKLIANLRSLAELPYRPTGFHYLYTFYVLRGDIVREWLATAPAKFFETNLVEAGFDRWLFEDSVPAVAEGMGYYPFFRVRHTHMSPVSVTRRRVRQMYRAWEQQLRPDQRMRMPPLLAYLDWRTARHQITRKLRHLCGTLGPS